MRAKRARDFLLDTKYSVKTVCLELFDKDGYLYDASVTAREDSIETAKAKKLAQLKEEHIRLHGSHNGLYWYHQFGVFLTTHNVEDYKMKRQWDDDGWRSICHTDAVDDEANEYEGLLYWKYMSINETGSTAGYTDDEMDTWQAEEVYREEIIEFDSFRPEIECYTACEQNQTLTDEQHISDDINRTFEDRPTFA